MTEYLKEAMVRRKTGWTHKEYMQESSQFTDVILHLEIHEFYGKNIS